MAIGKSGYITTTAKTVNGRDFHIRIGWSEEYDITTNKSVVTLTSFEVRYEYGGHWFPGGTLSVDGVDVVTMVNTTATHRITPPYGGETWAPIITWRDGAVPPWVSGEIHHNSDGSKSITVGIKINFWRSDDDYCDVHEEHTIELTAIPRASALTSAGDVMLGNACNVKWTPKAASFRYKLKFTLRNWSYTTDMIHPNTTSQYTYSGYTIPLDVAEQLPKETTGIMTVEMYTYSDSSAINQVGDADSLTFTVAVPDNNATKPSVSMVLDVDSTLDSKFDGLYVQGKSKVKASLSAQGKYKATIDGCTMKVEGSIYDDADGYTSGYLNTPGSVRVYGSSVDSRGFVGNTYQDITVIGYASPKVLPVSGERNVIAARCDGDGKLSDTGTYLKIKAKRSYAPVTASGVQKNFCQIRFRYKLESAEDYSAWITILEGSNLASDEIVTGALLDGTLSAESTYLVQVQAVDDIGESATTTVAVMTEVVYMHRTRNAMGLGKYVEGENLLDVAWDTHLRGEVKIGEAGMTLKEYILSVISEGG